MNGRTKVKVYTDNNGEPQPGIVLYAIDVVLCGARVDNASNV